MSASHAARAVERAVGTEEPWQLAMFRKSLKKRQKLALLLRLLGPLRREPCLLVTAGDNNGAMNHHLRAAGGSWRWAELEERTIAEMAAFLGEPVHHVRADAWPFSDAEFERVVVVDVHEHLTAVEPLNRELARVLAPGGVAVVTTPNGETRLPVAVLKRWIGMRPSVYGHVVQGYRVEELESMLRKVGLEPEARGGYARLFTELAELGINFAYVKVLARRKGGPPAPAGAIAPAAADELRSVRKAYRTYSIVYPFVRALSELDRLIPGTGDYAVAVTARKPS